MKIRSMQMRVFLYGFLDKRPLCDELAYAVQHGVLAELAGQMLAERRERAVDGGFRHVGPCVPGEVRGGERPCAGDLFLLVDVARRKRRVGRGRREEEALELPRHGLYGGRRGA